MAYLFVNFNEVNNIHIYLHGKEVLDLNTL